MVLALQADAAAAATIAYDPAGRRISKVIADSGDCLPAAAAAEAVDPTCPCYHDGSRTIEEHNASGKTTGRCLRPGEDLARPCRRQKVARDLFSGPFSGPTPYCSFPSLLDLFLSLLVP